MRNITEREQQSWAKMRPTFIDLFAGCGGLSLGLMQSGWKGLFAIERSPDAFKTLERNLIACETTSNREFSFNWPTWLEKRPHEIEGFIRGYQKKLQELRGQVTLIAGGPPCQGFSLAGRRVENDPRNQLFKKYLEVVDLIRPRFVLIENVKGIDILFGGGKRASAKEADANRKSYAALIKDSLEKHGYAVRQKLICASEFGVPQMRARYFTVGIRKDLINKDNILDLFEILRTRRSEFLKEHGLPVSRCITVEEALSDLRTGGKKLVNCEDHGSPAGFKQIAYLGPETRYQRLLHRGMRGNAPNSLRLPRHRRETVKRFKKIQSTCRKGYSLSDNDRERLGMKKHSLTPLAPNLPSRTLTTLPDDLLHYDEPRIHTVREHARLQSFPDWFEFLGKYTTGGQRRILECPRYTQVGNAVPPLLAEALGEALGEMMSQMRISKSRGAWKRSA